MLNGTEKKNTTGFLKKILKLIIAILLVIVVTTGVAFFYSEVFLNKNVTKKTVDLSVEEESDVMNDINKIDITDDTDHSYDDKELDTNNLDANSLDTNNLLTKTMNDGNLANPILEDSNEVEKQNSSLDGNETGEKINEQSVKYNKLVEKLAKSVVHIKGVYLKDAEDEDRFTIINAFGGEIFPAKKIKRQAICSGFFVSADGYIVTNHHCIDDVQDVSVETKDGTTYKATIAGYYEGVDLAVLKISPFKNEKFPFVKIGNSDELSVGDNIIVIGGPLGYKWSASAGIVSGKSRDLDYTGNEYSVRKHTWGIAGEYIQVDAAINGGNSGGPAFNSKGEVVGVASAGYTFLQGMKFIIASNTLSKYLEQLKNGKIVSQGLWGVDVNELEPYDVKAVGLKKNSGLIIHNVVKGSPAEKAGLKRGDIVVSVNGEEVKDKISLRNVNSKIFAGSISDVIVNRYGKIKKFTIKAENVKNIEKLEKGEIGIQEWSDGNLSYRLLTSGMHKKLRFPKDIDGIIVTEIKDNSDPMLTLAVGDVIMQVNEDKIESIEAYQDVLKKLKKENKDMAVFHVYKPTQNMVYVKGSSISFKE